MRLTEGDPHVGESITSTDPSQTNLFPVVIIGGGLAGLVAAAHLAERGIPPLLLDSDSLWPGGRLAGGDADTFTYDGRMWSFKPDHGVHAVWGGYENLRATLNRFTDTELTASTGEEWINRWGREVRMIEAGNTVRHGWLPAPFHYLQLLIRPRFWRTITPLDFLSLPGLLFSLLWAVGFDPLKERSPLTGLGMGDYFRLWTPNLKATFTGLGVNLLAAPADSISLSAFIAALRFYTVLRRDSWQMSFFPANSHDSLIQPLIDRIKANGGDILHGCTAARLEKKAGGWRVIVEDAAKRGLRSLNAGQVILATNAPGAARLLMNSPDTAPTAAEIHFPPALRNVVVRMWFDAAPRPGADSGMFTGDFMPDNFFWLHRLYAEFDAWHQTTGGSAIEVHVYGNATMLDQPDANLLIECVTEVQRAFPELKGHFVHGVIRRNSKNHTQFEIPTGKSLHVQTPWHGLYACGDWIGFDTPSLWMERATTTSIAAANQVLAQHNLPPYPILQPKRPELLAIILGGLVRLIRALFSPLVWVARRRRKSM